MDIGIFGGSFSPVHNGHINAAKSFIEQFSLDRLYIVPARFPPHKTLDAGASDADRLNMLKLAFSDTDRVVVSDFELKRSAVSYSCDTLRHYKREGRLYMLCGTDMFMCLDRWNRADEIMRMCCAVCVLRDGADRPKVTERASFYRDRYGADTAVLDCAAVPLSSTEIRQTIASGGDISGYLPESVSKYIIDNGLYK